VQQYRLFCVSRHAIMRWLHWMQLSCRCQVVAARQQAWLVVLQSPAAVVLVSGSQCLHHRSKHASPPTHVLTLQHSSSCLPP
jgi:hypothetical protein